MSAKNCLNTIVMCSDYRFIQVLIDWVNALGLLGKFDLIALPGSQKQSQSAEHFFCNALGTLIDLHDPEQVILIAHRDCGAYGGSEKFTSWHEEREYYLHDLREASELIQKEFPGVAVQRFIINCDGFDDASLPYNPRFEEV